MTKQNHNYRGKHIKVNFFRSMKHKLRKNFEQYWHKMIATDLSMSGKEGGNKLRTFRKFKHDISHENYLKMKDPYKRKIIAKLRISAHKLEIKTGRFTNINKYIKPEDMICDNYELDRPEDEFHFLIICPKYKSLRNTLFEYCIEANKYFKNYNDENKFLWIMSSGDMRLLNNLGTFLSEAFEMRIRRYVVLYVCIYCSTPPGHECIYKSVKKILQVHRLIILCTTMYICYLLCYYALICCKKYEDVKKS